jgi:hypothetical protein
MFADVASRLQTSFRFFLSFLLPMHRRMIEVFSQVCMLPPATSSLLRADCISNLRELVP